MLLLGLLSSVLVLKPTTNASVIRECRDVNGTAYSGDKTSSSSGEKCLNWLNVTKIYNLTINLDSDLGLWDHSYCRNPDSSPQPWCFVTSEDGIERQQCAIYPCQDERSGVSRVEVTSSGEGQAEPQSARPPRQSVAAKLDPGINRRVRFGPKAKKDLGVLGYALGALLMAIIVLLGSGITVGYFYRKGLKLRIQQDQRSYEQELHRINLPLSAFSNPTCDLADEEPAAVVVLSADDGKERGESEKETKDHGIHRNAVATDKENEPQNEG